MKPPTDAAGFWQSTRQGNIPTGFHGCPRPGTRWDRNTWVGAEGGGTPPGQCIVRWQPGMLNDAGETILDVFGSGTLHPFGITRGVAPYNVPAVQRIGYWLRKVRKLNITFSLAATYHSAECGPTDLGSHPFTFEVDIPEFLDCAPQSFTSDVDDQAHDIIYSGWDGANCVDIHSFLNAGIGLSFDLTNNCLLGSTLAARPWAGSFAWWPALTFDIFSDGPAYSSFAQKVRIGTPATICDVDPILSTVEGSATINDYFGGLSSFDLYRMPGPTTGTYTVTTLEPLPSGHLVDIEVAEINKYWEV